MSADGKMWSGQGCVCVCVPVRVCVFQSFVLEIFIDLACVSLCTTQIKNNFGSQKSFKNFNAMQSRKRVFFEGGVSYAPLQLLLGREQTYTFMCMFAHVT